MCAWLRSLLSANLLLLGVILPTQVLAAPPDQTARAVPSTLHDRARAEGEVRVLVENSVVSDEAAVMLSKDIARKIEDQLSYPGQIKVAVLRETRAIDYAK